MAKISNLYRYPIKGLSPEPLTEMAVSQGQGLPFDRAFALALGTTRFDPEAPEPLDKGYFLMLRKNEQLAALATRLDPETGRLTIRHRGAPVLEAAVTSAEGRAAIEDFMAAYLGEATEGRPRLVSAAGHKFTDVSVVSPVMMKAISVINLASVRALEEATVIPCTPCASAPTSISTACRPGRSSIGSGGRSRSAEYAFAGHYGPGAAPPSRQSRDRRA